MAEAITITCPECEKKLTVPAAAVGKKIRCKGCEHVFAVPAPAASKPAVKAQAGKPAAGKADDAKKKGADPKAVKPKAAAEDEEDSNPYGVTSEDTAPRCPDCANELESEDAVVCLVCGYNTRTRTRAQTRAVEETTVAAWILWLLPGILCVLFILFTFTFDVWYSFKIQGLVADAWYEFLGHQAVIIWLWIMCLFAMFFAGRFAVKRLIFNPRPPERVKKKKPK